MAFQWHWGPLTYFLFREVGLHLGTSKSEIQPLSMFNEVQLKAEWSISSGLYLVVRISSEVLGGRVLNRASTQ